MAKIDHEELTDSTREFFTRTIGILTDAGIPFLLGGAYALSHYTGITRHTKDLDVFVRPQHCQAALDVLSEHGYRTELTFEDWLGKAICNDDFVDLIFNSRNRIAAVDDDWFRFSEGGTFLGREVRLAPAEETVWSKAFIMERERYDGADIAHILHAQADKLNWHRLMRRFGEHWRVLYVHIILFGFIYPSQQRRIPRWVLGTLARNLADETRRPPPSDSVFRGTMLSAQQYEIDLRTWGYRDILEPGAGDVDGHDEDAH